MHNLTKRHDDLNMTVIELGKKIDKLQSEYESKSIKSMEGVPDLK